MEECFDERGGRVEEIKVGEGVRVRGRRRGMERRAPLQKQGLGQHSVQCTGGGPCMLACSNMKRVQWRSDLCLRRLPTPSGPSDFLKS